MDPGAAILCGMDVVVCWGGDKIGRRVGRAVLADDVGEVRRVDQAINAGNDLWRAFALRCGGNIIEIGGDEGRIQVPASNLGEMPDVARQYAQTVGATVSVGVAMKMSEAAKALLVAKLRGGNQITIWDPEMQAEIDEVNAHPQAEKDKLSEEYLGKAAPGVAGDAGHAGMTGSSRGSKVKGTQGDHEEGAVASQLFDDAPDAPEGTHAAQDFEDQLHDEASKQDQKDQQDTKQQESHLGEVKQRLVAALQTVRQSMPKIQQISQSSPEVYASLMALTQGLVDLGREVVGSESQGTPPPAEDVQKSEALAKTVSGIQPGKRSINGPGRLSFDYSHHLSGSDRAAGLGLRVTHVAAGPAVGEHLLAELHHNGRDVGGVTAYVDRSDKTVEPHSELTPEYRGRGLGQSMYEALYAHAKNKLGIQSVSGGSHSADAHRLHTSLAKKHGFGYKPEVHEDMDKYGYPYKPYNYTLKGEPGPAINDDEIIGPNRGVTFHHEDVSKEQKLDKAALGAQGGAQAGRQHLELPAGSVMDGKIKVFHGTTGQTSWKHVQSGMVSGTEADSPTIGANSHPVSSRSPGSK